MWRARPSVRPSARLPACLPACLPVCELMSAIKPFARICEIRCRSSLHHVIKKRLFCAYRLSGSRHSAVCLSVCVATFIVLLRYNSSQGIRAPFFTIDEFRENGRSGSGALTDVSESTLVSML
jgi:hypothetical protein